MNEPVTAKAQLYKAIEQLNPEQLAQVLQYVRQLAKDPVTSLSVHERHDDYAVGSQVGEAVAPATADGASPTYAIEFIGQVRDGAIEVPEPYRHQLKDTVRVVLVVEEQAQESDDMIQRLLDNPLVVPGFVPLSRDDVYAES